LPIFLHGHEWSCSCSVWLCFIFSLQNWWRYVLQYIALNYIYWCDLVSNKLSKHITY
jgi:hypothetical protein